MNISSYDDLINAAKQQAEPQRLLFVFAAAGLPDDPTADQKERFRSGKGGVLSPVMCVDKLPDEAGSFSGLVEESRQTGMGWDVVFVASLSGRAGIAPSSDEAEQPLTMMVEAVQNGAIANFLAFNRDGEPIQLF